MDNMNNGNMTYDYSMQPNQPAKPVTPAAPAKPGATQMLQFQSAYPEVYYKLQPYISMVCDQMMALGDKMPSQEMLDQISDNIYEDIMKRDPSFAEYIRREEENANSNLAIQTVRMGFDPMGYGFRFRRRGLFRDLIDTLLLAELFGRRRRYYYY